LLRNHFIPFSFVPL